jgi:hypothetical protein
MKMVKEQSNLYARQNQTPEQRTKWKTITLDEVHKFFAVILHVSCPQAGHS